MISLLKYSQYNLMCLFAVINLSLAVTLSNILTSVADPHHIDADPDPARHFDADPDPARHFDADPDPARHFDADPDPSRHFDADPDPSFQIKA